MLRRIRSGIVGAGMIAEVHAHALRAAGGTLVAVADSTADAAVLAAARLGAERAVPSVEELIAADDIDVVHICAPNHVHAPIAELALRAGKAVVCEKPLAVDAPTAQSLVDLAQSAGVIHAVPFVYRFYPSVREARARVSSGSTGPVRLIHGSYLQDWLALPGDHNWRVDSAIGGASRAFADIGVHWCDIVEFATGQRILRLAAKSMTAYPNREAGGEMRPVDTEDAVVILFETDSGAIGSLVLSQVSHGRKNQLWFSLDGEVASLAFDQESPDSLWVGGREANQVIHRGASASSPAVARYNVLPAGHPQGYRDCFTAFVSDVYACVQGTPVDGLPTFADGLRAARLTEAVLQSAKQQTWVEVD
jgi:predicted dehydrogenase